MLFRYLKAGTKVQKFFTLAQVWKPQKCLLFGHANTTHEEWAFTFGAFCCLIIVLCLCGVHSTYLDRIEVKAGGLSACPICRHSVSRIQKYTILLSLLFAFRGGEKLNLAMVFGSGSNGRAGFFCSYWVVEKWCFAEVDTTLCYSKY